MASGPSASTFCDVSPTSPRSSERALILHPIAADLVIDAAREGVVAADDVLARVDAIWTAEQTRRSTPLRDGELFSLATWSGSRWSGSFVPYRWFVAQLRDPGLFGRLRVRPVAVSGVLAGPDGLVFGRRARDSTQFPGWWELAPSGGLDRSSQRGDGTIDYVGKVVEELVEETGCPASSVTRARSFVAVEDFVMRSIDIGVELSTDWSREEILDVYRSQANREYQAIEVVHTDDIGSFVHRYGGELVDISRALLVELGYLSTVVF